VYLFRSKNEAKELFLKYEAEVVNELDRKIKRLIINRGAGQYDTNYLTSFSEKNSLKD